MINPDTGLNIAIFDPASVHSPKIKALFELLTVTPTSSLEQGRQFFSAPSADVVGTRVFGGQVIAQALLASAQTTEKMAHSLHAYFLSAGDTTVPVDYEVTVLRDGRSFSSRRVDARQNGQLILTAMLSFASAEDGLNFQIEPPTSPLPESLLNETQLKQRLKPHAPEKYHAMLSREGIFDARPVKVLNPFAPAIDTPDRQFWMRIDEKLPDDPLLHQAILAFASDFYLMGTAFLPHGLSFLNPKVQAASIDHSVYFHHDVRVDEWFLSDMTASVTSHARGLSRANIWQNHQLSASTTQEGLMRIREKSKV